LSPDLNGADGGAFAAIQEEAESLLTELSPPIRDIRSNARFPPIADVDAPPSQAEV